jgi:hypothetical protein
VSLETRCTACSRGQCEDCLTLGMYCSCCGKIWGKPDEDDEEDE